VRVWLPVAECEFAQTAIEGAAGGGLQQMNVQKGYSSQLYWTVVDGLPHPKPYSHKMIAFCQPGTNLLNLD